MHMVPLYDPIDTKVSIVSPRVEEGDILIIESLHSVLVRTYFVKVQEPTTVQHSVIHGITLTENTKRIVAYRVGPHDKLSSYPRMLELLYE